VDIGAARGARQPEAARHSLTLIIAASALVLSAFTSFGPNSVSGLTRGASWASVMVLVVIAVVLRRVPAERLDRCGAWVAVAVGGVLLVCVMNLITRDASAAGQAFLAFPVIWCAAHLRRPVVTVVTATAMAGDAVVLLVLEDVESAVTDLVSFGTMLAVISVMLVRAGELHERLVAMLRGQASFDSLTGLMNRRVMDDALGRALAGVTPDRGAGLVLLDVDRFKAINDEHGHPVGDDALVHVAAVLRSVVRATDAVLSRMGGDELAVLLPRCSAQVAVRRAEEVLHAVRAAPLVLADGRLVRMSVSLGVAHAPSHANGLEALYAAADAALYTAKRNGRDRVAVATP
jgi:diguanylate cyclase (GGDEF)-like protein